MSDQNNFKPIFQHQEVLHQYFHDLTPTQKAQFDALGPLYHHWNARINVISRKDILHLYPRHILHSLAIAKIMAFQQGAQILDLGTGGGFPGLPLAILFPSTHFYLVDAIQKKINVVRHITEALNLTNVTPLWQRAETLEGAFDFILSRAVAKLSSLHQWTQGKLKTQHHHTLPNGLLCWKGGDLTAELANLPMQHQIYPLKKIFPQPFFQDKVIAHLFA